jgi:hypothetical protein
MDENELFKKIYIYIHKPWRSKRTRRSKSRWIDEVEEDARKLGCTNWLTTAQDRSHWRYLLEKAKAHLGLYSR